MVEFQATFNNPNEMDANFEDDPEMRTGFGEVIEAAGAVRYDRAQSLTEEEKKRARDNIGADAVIDFESRRLKQIGGQYYSGFTAYNRSTHDFMTLEDIAALSPVLARVRWGSYPFNLYITGTIRKSANDWSSFIVDLGELGRFQNDTGTTTFWIKSSFIRDHLMPDNANALTLRAWAQTFDTAVQEQMRSNIGAASENDLTTHSSDTSVHFTGTEKADIQQEITDLQPFIVRATAITGSEYYTLDKTYNEITLAVLSGKRVYIDTGEEVFPYTTIVSFAGMTMIIFGATLSSGNNLVTRGVAVAQDVAMRVNFTSGLVTSVNGNDGDVSLDAVQVGAVPADTVGVAGGVASLDSSGKVPDGQLPSIPARTSDLTNDGADGTSTYVEADELAPVATSGSYNDLDDKPKIPANTSDLNNDSDFISESAVDTKLETKADSAGASADYAARLTAGIPYGQVDSTSTSTAYTATVPGITELKNGVCVLLKNGVVTSAANFTIDINGLGAKGAYSNMAASTRETTTFNVNYTILFIYDETRVAGGGWVYYRGFYSDSNSIGYQLRTNSSTLPTTDKLYRYRLLFMSPDHTHWIPANTSTSTNATSARNPNQRPIDPFGGIRYYGTTATINAGANVTATQLWEQYALTFGYSFAAGSALTMTFPAPVYLRCVPQPDGSAIIENSQKPWTQTLPTTEDGFIYIFLGVAYSETGIELYADHPVYYYKDGRVRLWLGQDIPAGLPAVTSADNGKVLQVVNGVWTLTTMPNTN